MATQYSVAERTSHFPIFNFGWDWQLQKESVAECQGKEKSLTQKHSRNLIWRWVAVREILPVSQAVAKEIRKPACCYPYDCTFTALVWLGTIRVERAGTALLAVPAIKATLQEFTYGRCRDCLKSQQSFWISNGIQSIIQKLERVSYWQITPLLFMDFNISYRRIKTPKDILRSDPLDSSSDSGGQYLESPTFQTPTLFVLQGLYCRPGMNECMKLMSIARLVHIENFQSTAANATHRWFLTYVSL